MVSTRRSNNIPVEGSWRMVEGEHDSFDTSIVQDAFDENNWVMSSGQSQQTTSSQDLASQESIRDFADRADEDEVILRAPFRPSLTSTRHASMDRERTPVPEFVMPAPTVNTSPRRSSTRSSRTIRPGSIEASQVRRRAPRQDSPDEAYPGPTNVGIDSHRSKGASQQPGPSHPSTNREPGILMQCLGWIASVVGIALRFAKWPIAFLLALYIVLGVSIMTRNIVTNSVTASLQPICRIPGVSFLDIPFCTDDTAGSGPRQKAQPVAFDELMNVQSQFEKVLEDSAQGVSLPMDMKRAEASVRDLRTLVKYSDLPSREELVLEFDGYINSIRSIVNDLQSFNTHVGGAVDSVISINRWTSRYIDSIATTREAQSQLYSWHVFEWLFSPFQPVVFHERMILEKYIEHTSFVSDKIQGLILEAQETLRLLSQADDHLQRIDEFIVRNGQAVKEKRSEALWDLWTFVGANNRQLNKLSAQLSLLKQVDGQRNTAVKQLLGLVHDLGDIQTKLSDLRDRVAAPELLADTTSIPLSVHIETIDAGIQRLESARVRIRAEENERLQQALARGKGEIPLIESK
ncbi:hypothetical protein NPX13_g4926 [Xylaria arbuscula]|uniref:Uncharacterized protein n=1 Tax=Xylaria arbuscula TaxID=114810 RepID=A0A9W8NEX6_9PEZI|nr:hypothetical protein NPX13_g4926 [Xylaria arbuscula]